MGVDLVDGGVYVEYGEYDVSWDCVEDGLVFDYLEFCLDEVCGF